nr:translation initiation factor IF-2-like [Saimiri boliviensis boliviensis]
MGKTPVNTYFTPRLHHFGVGPRQQRFWGDVPAPNLHRGPEIGPVRADFTRQECVPPLTPPRGRRPRVSPLQGRQGTARGKRRLGPSQYLRAGRRPQTPGDRRKGCGPARAPRVVSGRRPCPPAPGRKLLRCPPVPLTPQSGGAGQRASRPIFQQRRQQPEEARGRVPPTRRGASVLGRGRRRGGVLTAAFPNSSSAVVARRRLPGTSASTAISPSLSPRFPRFLLPLLPPAPCRPAPARRPRALRHGVTPTGPTAGGSRGGRRLTHVGSAPARCTGVVPTAAPTPLPGSGDFALSAPGAGVSVSLPASPWPRERLLLGQVGVAGAAPD